MAGYISHLLVLHGLGYAMNASRGVGGNQLLSLRADAVSDGGRIDFFIRQFSQPTTEIREYAIAT